MNSIWQKTLVRSHFESLEKDIRTDVLVIGGGICGLLCAYMLKREGIDCVVLEGERICEKTTAGTTAKITAQHGLIYDKILHSSGMENARLYYDANTAAINEYRKLCNNIDCNFTDTSSFVYSLDSRQNLLKEQIALKKIGVFASLENPSSLPFKTVGALKFENQACFNPLKFAKHISEGIKIYENSRVEKISGNVAYTKKARVIAKRIIVATHFPFINRYGLYSLKMYQSRSYVIALEGAEPSDGVYIDEKEGGISLRPCTDILLFGGGGHRTGKGKCAYDELEKLAKRYYPKSIVKYRWATQDCMTLDGIPYIGKYSPFSENLYVATGFNKWGMSSSMVAAMLLTDMLTGRKNKYEKLFNPSRSIFHPQLATNIKESLSGLLSQSEKRCSHLGCALKWNKAEHSWDCGCHGSRFDKDGNVLNNPANKELKGNDRGKI